MTIYSINRDQSASYIKHNLSYGDRIDNVLVITVIAEFTNEIPKLKETFIFDEREGQIDIDKIVSMVIHDYVSAWFWKKDWDAYNGVDGKSFNSRGVFEYFRMHNYRSFMSVNMVRNEVKESVDIHTLKTGDLLVDVITVIAEFTNEIPKLKETFIFDEREVQIDIDKSVSRVIHDYVAAWFWKKRLGCI